MCWSSHTVRVSEERGKLMWCGQCCVLLQLEAAVACLVEAEVPIKRLLLTVDLARQGLAEGAAIPLQRWTQTLADLSLS